MHFTSIMIALIGVFTLLVTASPVVTDDIASASAADLPFPLVPMQYNGTLAGYDISPLTGTVQQLFAQLKVLYPEFDVDAFRTKNAAARHISPVDTRSPALANPICCPVPCQDWDACEHFNLQDSISDLDAMKGNVVVPPRSCVEIACYEHAGISWCNDNTIWKFATGGVLGAMATQIDTHCALLTQTFVAICGQQFDGGPPNTNIIVRRSGC